MICQLTDLENIIIKNPNRDLITSGVAKSKTLRMHMYGEGMPQHLKVITGFEKDWIHQLRVQYTRTNEDLFDRLGRPEDKVYSAKGGSIYYNLTEAQERQAVRISADVRNGYSIKEWIENFWRLHHKDDPCGVIMMEILPQAQAMQARKEGRSFVYPTYKGIAAIYDYLPKGVTLEYIAFKLEYDEIKGMGYKEGDIVYRLVDDAYDYIIQRHADDTITIDWANTIVNFFGSVPAIINSDIIDPLLENSFLSVYSRIVALADEFLRKGSIKVTSDFRHGFPKYAEYGDKCSKCHGEGVSEGTNCTNCKGSGKVIRLRVTDDKIMEWPLDKETPVIHPKDTGGYIEPPRTYYEIAINDMSMLENLMCRTMWGVPSKIKINGLSVNAEGAPKTATEEMLDIKPQADRLQPISKAAEKRHKFILDMVVRVQVAAFYSGSNVIYGRRYMLEGPDALWEKYAKAKKEGVAITSLNEMLIAYYEAEYATDPVKLAVLTKMIKVEPFVHYKVNEVLNFRLSDEEYKAKLYYGEWLSLQPAGYIYAMPADMLRQSLYDFVKTKQLQPLEPTPVVA